MYLSAAMSVELLAADVLPEQHVLVAAAVQVRRIVTRIGCGCISLKVWADIRNGGYKVRHSKGCCEA